VNRYIWSRENANESLQVSSEVARSYTRVVDMRKRREDITRNRMMSMSVEVFSREDRPIFLSCSDTRAITIMLDSSSCTRSSTSQFLYPGKSLVCHHGERMIPHGVEARPRA
jgi:hypothetical protein